jgi:hypothetical protein
MTNKRTFPRLKRRLMVKFTFDGAARTGFSRDLSHTGLFIKSVSVPPIGEPLSLTVTLPNGKNVLLEGKVVRGYRAAGLVDVEHGGFSFELGGYVEAYANYVASLGEV